MGEWVGVCVALLSSCLGGTAAAITRYLVSGADPIAQFKSIHDVLGKLPADTLVYPGHDYGEVPFRTLMEESRWNPALRANSSS